MGQDERHLAALGQILQLAVLVNADMAEELARQGLTVPRAQLLWTLHQHGATTQRTLATALKVSPRNITGLVDGLVATGFVTREAHPTDRRATLVSFTEHGAQTARRLEDGRDEFAEVLFTGMSDQDFTGLTAGLDVVLTRLKRALAGRDS